MSNTSKEKMVIVLPFPLPTWNRILAMGVWQRKKLRDLIHQFVYISIAKEEGWLTPTVYQLKQQSMELLMPEYYQMIRPKLSKKYRIPKNK